MLYPRMGRFNPRF